MDIGNIIEQIDLLYSQQNVDGVETLILASLSKFGQNEVYPAIMLINELLGIYRERGDKDNSLKYVDQVLSLFNDNNLPKDEHYATTILNVATVYRVFGDFSLAEEYYNNCIEIYTEVIDKNDYRFASLYNNLSLLHTQKQEIDKSIEYLNKSIEILQKNQGTQVQVATANTSLAQIYMNANNIEQAKHNVNIALDIFDKFDDYHHSASLATAGDIANFEKDYINAKIYYKNSMAVIKRYIGETQNYMIIKENLEIVEKNSPANGLSISKEFYTKFGLPMLENKFKEYIDKMAIGLVGHGSECLGLDDKISHDHDFGAGFCIWLTDDIYDKIGNQLQLEYNKLPADFIGVNKVDACQFGEKRVGVFKIDGFYNSILSTKKIPQTDEEFLSITENSLLTATNGEIFTDELGEFSNIRNSIKHYPKRLLIKKIADTSHIVSQTGQYNFARALKRKDYVTARIILSEFISSTIDLIFLLNKEYAPFYKCKYRKLKELPILFNVSRLIEKIEKLSVNLDDKNIINLIELTVSKIITELKFQGYISMVKSNFLDEYMEDIMRGQLTEEKKKLVETIVKYEWEAFDKVQGIDGRATCQDDYNTFNIMRSSQYMAWTSELINSFIADFEKANSEGRNLISEKYAHMMKSTDPVNYSNLEHLLPKPTPEQADLIEEIIKKQLELMIELKPKYPNLVSNARVLRTSEDSLYETSYETYLRGELYTYSENTTKLYNELLDNDIKNDTNTVKLYITNTAILYGFDDIDSAEASICG